MNSQHTAQRPLNGMVIGISISESDDLAGFGYSSADVNRTTVRMSEALLAAGAQLIFGHDWRPDGIMDAICRLAIRYQPSGEYSSSAPLIQSLVPWPSKSLMEPTLRTELEQRRVLKIEMLPAPRGDLQSPDDPTARALALVEMRKKLAECSDARVCLGGKDGLHRPVQGFYAGVIEEAFRSVRAEKPVYFGSFLGGVCARVIEELKTQMQQGTVGAEPDATKKGKSQIFSVVPDKHVLLGNMLARIKEIAQSALESETGTSKETGTPPRPFARMFFDTREQADKELPQDLGNAFDNTILQARSGLKPAEWSEMLDAPDTEAFVTWVIRGLRRVASERQRAKTVKATDEQTTASTTATAESALAISPPSTAKKTKAAPTEPEDKKTSAPKKRTTRRRRSKKTK